MRPLPSKLSQSPPPSTTNVEDDEEEEDYMSMALPTVPNAQKKPETSIQRRLRLRREAEERGRVKSKSEKAAEEAAAREKALQTSLIPENSELLGVADVKTNKGLAMMAKMGFKPGTALGKSGSGRIDPIGVEIKIDKGGIGLDTEKKRKFREVADLETQHDKAEELGYRERIMKEKEDARLERLVGGAMRVLEGLEEIGEGDEGEEGGGGGHGDGVRRKPLKSINVLYRGLIRNRELRDREKRMRHDLQQSLSRLPSYTDPSEDADDKLAYSSLSGATKDNAKAMVLEEELEEEDEELEAFEAMDVRERLGRVVGELRGRWWYCFWCKFRYEGEGLDGCPGWAEEDHD